MVTFAAHFRKKNMCAFRKILSRPRPPHKTLARNPPRKNPMMCFHKRHRFPHAAWTDPIDSPYTFRRALTAKAQPDSAPCARQMLLRRCEIQNNWAESFSPRSESALVRASRASTFVSTICKALLIILGRVSYSRKKLPRAIQNRFQCVSSRNFHAGRRFHGFG